MIENLKNLIKLFINDKDLLSVVLKKNEHDVPTVNIQVSSNDMKRVIGSGGRVYRSLKTLVKYSLNNEFADLIIDVNNNK